MKIAIWGAGIRGKRMLARLKDVEVVCFIDSDENKIGTVCEGKEIIGLQEYMQKYPERFILISVVQPIDIVRHLEEKGIYRYFILKECPSELQMPGRDEIFEMFVQNLLQNRKEACGVYGTSFYSLYIWERLKKCGCRKAILIPEADCKEQKLNELKKEYGCCGDEDLSDIKRILVTVDTADVYAEIGSVYNGEIDAIEIEDIFDNIKRIPEYRNQELCKFKNIHAGDKCFIVATGPSLKMEDLETLRKNQMLSMGVNRIYLAFENTKWRPDYYVCTDPFSIHEDKEIIRNLPVKYKFIGDTYEKFWEGAVPENIYKTHIHFTGMPEKTMRFSDDISYGVYSGETVVYAGIQIAVYMGFKEIYLLGVDFSFSANYKDASNHFTENYYTKESRTAFFREEENLQAYLKAREYAGSRGVKIYNATRGGKLEVFERVDFDRLFISARENKK